MATRTTNATADEDANGTGRDGFTDGDPPGTGTIADSEWLNNVQEEICLAVEEDGTDLDAEDFRQLTRRIAAESGGLMDSDRSRKGGGLVLSDIDGLDVQALSAGFIYTNTGQKRHITEDRIDASGVLPITFDVERDSYVYVRVDPADEEAVEFLVVDVANGASDPTASQDDSWALIGRVITDATEVTDIDDYAAVPMLTTVSADALGTLDVPVPTITATKRMLSGFSTPQAFPSTFSELDYFYEEGIAHWQFTAGASPDTADVIFMSQTSIPIGSTATIEMLVTAVRVGSNNSAHFRNLVGIRRNLDGTLVLTDLIDQQTIPASPDADSRVALTSNTLFWRMEIDTSGQEWQFVMHWRVIRMVTAPT